MQDLHCTMYQVPCTKYLQKYHLSQHTNPSSSFFTQRWAFDIKRRLYFACLPQAGISYFVFLLKTKSPSSLRRASIMWRRPTLPGVTPVPSALQGLTSLFGMGRGGTPALGRLNLCKTARAENQEPRV